jgi:hypothetical protein
MHAKLKQLNKTGRYRACDPKECIEDPITRQADHWSSDSYQNSGGVTSFFMELLVFNCPSQRNMAREIGYEVVANPLGLLIDRKTAMAAKSAFAAVVDAVRQVGKKFSLWTDAPGGC